MAKTPYKDVNFRPGSLKLIKVVNAIIADYLAQGLKLTLRQVYYQGVTRNLYPNSEKSYKNLGSLVSDARLAGLMDWDAIEDRVRRPRTPSEFRDLGDLVNAALYTYRLPRWEGQENYVEVVTEKDALAGVLEPIASKFHVTMLVNRGYSSSSAMHETAQRYRYECRDGKRPVLLYVGDMDPSGEDMVRDIAARLDMFGVARLDVRKLALTMDQVDEHRPPPQPAKLSDSRAKAYIAEHGRSSWEVDALSPRELTRIITEELEGLVDRQRMDAVIAREEVDKRVLRAAVAGNKKLQ